MRRMILGLMVLFLLLPVDSAQAQGPAELRRAAIGGAVGVAGGAAVTLSAIVARARFGREYLEGVEDLIHWQTTPMIMAPAAGVVFGLAGEEALRASIVGSTAGLAIGAVLGSGVGWVLSKDQEGPWAGGVIGAGVGLATGGLIEGLRAWSEDENSGLDYPRFLRFSFSLPVR